MTTTQPDGRPSRRVHFLEATTWLGLLAPEDTVVWKAPDALVESLRAGLAGDDVHRAVVASNRLALELFRAGLLDEAQQCCRLQIRHLSRHASAASGASLLLLGLQGAVNLIRIHGYSADLERALEGLALVEGLADGRPAEVFGFAVTKGAVAAETEDARRIRAFARSNRIVETAKILFRRGRWDLGVDECARLCAKWPAAAMYGPFHAHELLGVLDVPWPLGDRERAIAPALATIRDLHQLFADADAGASASVRDPASRPVLDLFRSRADSGLGAGVAQPRYLAVLGDALLRLGHRLEGDVCLREAHRLAVPLDPRLADQIVARWACHDVATDHLPLPMSVPQPDPAELLSVLDMAAGRFGRDRPPRRRGGNASLDPLTEEYGG